MVLAKGGALRTDFDRVVLNRESPTPYADDKGAGGGGKRVRRKEAAVILCKEENLAFTGPHKGILSRDELKIADTAAMLRYDKVFDAGILYDINTGEQEIRIDPWIFRIIRM